MCYNDIIHMAEGTKSDATKKVAEWWSDSQREVPGTQWVEVPGALENMNRRATGDPGIDWINHSASVLAHFKKPIKALSLGCGFGLSSECYVVATSVSLSMGWMLPRAQ